MLQKWSSCHNFPPARQENLRDEYTVDWAGSLMAPCCLSAPWEMSSYTTCNITNEKKKLLKVTHAQTADILKGGQGKQTSKGRPDTGRLLTSVFCWGLQGAVKWKNIFLKTIRWIEHFFISVAGYKIGVQDTFARGSATFLGYRAPRWGLWSRVWVVFVHSCMCGQHPGKWPRLHFWTQTTRQPQNDGQTKSCSGTDQHPVQYTPLRGDSWGETQNNIQK